MKAHTKLDLVFGGTMALVMALPFVASDAGIGLLVLTVIGPIILGSWMQADELLSQLGHRR